MKTAAILVTAALAVGTSAFAQTRDESIGQKADRVFDRMENATKRGIDKIRGTGDKEARRDNRQDAREAGREVKQEAKEAKREVKQEAKEAKREAQRDDTRTMGAGRSDRDGSGDRQARMDDAYGNWKNQQKR